MKTIDLFEDNSDFHERYDAAQELRKDAVVGNCKLIIDSSAYVKLYHSTSEKNADSILSSGKINRQSYFSSNKNESIEHTKAKHKKLVTLELHVDPRAISFNSGTREFYSENGLERTEYGKWVEAKQTIEEMPITNLQKIGNWDKNSSYKEKERKLLNNPKALDKIVLKWARIPQNFNMYFVNSPEANRNNEVGNVNLEWLENNMPKAFSEFKYDPNAINILFNSNKGDGKVPMTAWIIAHRFGHAVTRLRGFDPITRTLKRHIFNFTEIRNIIFRYMNYIMKLYGVKIPDTENRYYDSSYIANNDKILKYFFQNIGTMKSARDGTLRNEFEFTLELLAQYLLTGKIKFNSIPKSFKAGNYGYLNFSGSEADYEYINQELEMLAEELEYKFDDMLSECIGKIFVM